MVALCRWRGRAKGRMQPAPAAAQAKQEVEKGSKKKRVRSWGQGSWGAPRSSALCWAGLAPAPPAPHRAVPGQQEGAGSCSGGCGAGPCRAGGIHRVTAPKKRNPQPGRELLALGTLRGPAWGSHQGRGPTRLHITSSSPAHPQLPVRDPSAIPRLPAAALRRRRSQSEFLGSLQR